MVRHWSTVRKSSRLAGIRREKRPPKPGTGLHPSAAMKTTEITQVVDALQTTRGGDSRRRVLIAMSGAPMRKLLAAEARAAGLDVVEASEATEALDHVARSLVDGDWRLPIDLAICDLS